MTGDAIGLSFFTDGERPSRPARPSVFGVLDQDEVTARFDLVADDDLESTFFGSTIQEVEDAATRIFDVGIRTVTNDVDPSPQSTAFAGAVQAPARAEELPAADASELLVTDTGARREFILGGPAGLVR